jgi:hypothetical protein
VKILEDDEEWLDLALPEQKALDGVQGPVMALRGLERLPPRILHRCVQKREERREGGLEGRIERQHFPGQLLPDLPGIVARLHLAVGFEELGQRQVGRASAVGDRVCLHDEPAVGTVGVCHLPHQARLADTRLADERHDLAVAGCGAAERLSQLLELGVPPDEPGEPAGAARGQAGASRPGADEFVGLHRRIETLHRHRPPRGHLDVPFREPERLGGDERRPGARELLQARRQVGGLADRAVVHAEIAADRADHDLAGIESHAHLERDAVATTHPLGVAADRRLQVKGGIAGPDGVVLVGHRGAEQGHDPVAHDLVDGALVAVDGVHHPLEDGIEQPPGLLGVAVGEQLHRALEVREQHGDLLALSFQGRLRGQDLLGEVLRGVAFGCAESRARRRLRGLALTEPLTALLAELSAELIRGAATGAGSLESSPALLAEDGVGGVFVLAARTPHHGVSGAPKASMGRRHYALRLLVACRRFSIGVSNFWPDRVMDLIVQTASYARSTRSKHTLLPADRDAEGPRRAQGADRILGTVRRRAQRPLCQHAAR